MNLTLRQPGYAALTSITLTPSGGVAGTIKNRLVDEHVERAEADGARICCGGTPLHPDSGGNFFAPTVIDGASPSMAIAHDEIFGPVVCVIGFDDDAEALAIANDTDYGLSVTVWSGSLDTALGMARAVNAGTVSINGYSEGDITTPFGGFRQSGFGGRDKGLEAFDLYTELKTVWITLR